MVLPDHTKEGYSAYRKPERYSDFENADHLLFDAYGSISARRSFCLGYEGTKDLSMEERQIVNNKCTRWCIARIS